MKTVNLIINDRKIAAREGATLLWAALDNSIFIPNLCALRDRPEPQAACRLCFVEVEGYSRPVTACTEAVRAGMVVNTRGPSALRLARTAFELLMTCHPIECACCPLNRSCELQKIAVHLGLKLKSKRFRQLTRGLPVDVSHPDFIYDPNKCVLCGRCVWVCRRHGKDVLGFAYRGFQRRVATFADRPIGEVKCGDCRECVSVCPAGALLWRNAKPEMKTARISA